MFSFGITDLNMQKSKVMRYPQHLHSALTAMQGEAREETRNKTKTSGESPCGAALPVILSLVSKLEAFCFFNLKPDTHIPLQLYVDMDNRSLLKELNEQDSKPTS